MTNQEVIREAGNHGVHGVHIFAWFLIFAAIGFGATLSVQAQFAPYAHTQAAGPITTTTATLNGMLVPNGADTIAWFEWGTNSSYGQTTAPLNVGNGTTVMRVSSGISNLPSQFNFWSRLVASNAVGVSYGAPVLLTTGQRLSAWGSGSQGQTTVPTGLGNVVATEGGGHHSLALKPDGTVVAWGANDNGQTDVPAGLSNVVFVAGGYNHSLALKIGGTVAAWGFNYFGQTNVPYGLSNVVGLAGGGDHSLALKLDGTVVAWGYNSDGQTIVPANLSNVVAIAAGSKHNLALRADGVVVAWGLNNCGQVNVPAGMSNVVAVATGGVHSLALKADGTVVAWGYNSNGEANVPAGLSNVVAVAANGYHSLALKSDGTVTAWGWNINGVTDVPSDLSKVVAVEGGHNHSLALGNLPPRAKGQTNFGVASVDLPITLTSNDPNGDSVQYRVVTLPAAGSLYQWTPSGRGLPIIAPNTAVEDIGGRVVLALPVFGSDTFTFVASDHLADSVPATVVITFGPPWVCTQPVQPRGTTAATLYGSVLASFGTKAWFEWGMVGSYGQSTEATDIAGDRQFSRLTAVLTNLSEHADYQCRVVASNALGIVYGAPILFTTGKKISAWGDNISGQTTIPVALSNVVAVAAGASHSLALNSDKSVMSWGGNSHGQATIQQCMSNVLAVAAGGDSSLALKSDGTVLAWGANDSGQTNVPSGLSNIVAIAAGGGHMLALNSDGSVTAWGRNTSGQTNVPTDLLNVVAVAAGKNHSIALRLDGTVVAWGNNDSAQTRIPKGLSNVVAVTAGFFHSLALKADGTVAAWGHYAYGLTNVPAGLSNVVAVSAGAFHSLAMKADGTVAAWEDNGSGPSHVPLGLSNVVAVASGGYHNLTLGNMPPQAQDQADTGVALSELLITLRASDTNNDVLTYRVVTLPAAGQLFQWTPAGRGSPITTSNTLVEDIGGRVVYMLPSLGIDSFAFTANDGLADSVELATVSVRTTSSLAFTRPVRPAGLTGAILCGAVIAGPGTMVWYEWGGIGSYDQRTEEMALIGDGVLTQVPSLLTNLAAHSNYQCRIVASNAFGVTYGAPAFFTTGRQITAWGQNKLGQTTVPNGLSNVVAVAAGENHSMVLTSEGTVAAWGNSAYGLTNIPAGLSNVMAISAAGTNSMALMTDGSVIAWGSNAHGQTNLPAGLSNVVAVASGYYHNMALRADGTVVAWGYNYHGQTNVPNDLHNVVAIAAGGHHCLALKADGKVVSWGYSFSGQSNVLAGLSNVIAVAAGGGLYEMGFSVAVKADGTGVSWGSSLFGSGFPAGLSNAVSVAAGASHCLAVTAEGKVISWGYFSQTSVPVSFSNVVAIAAGAYHNLATGGNVPPQALAQTNTAKALQDVTITLRGSDANGDFLNYRVTTLPTSGTLYQWTAIGRGAPITIDSAPVEDPGGRVILSLPANGSSSFTFMANDGQADSGSAGVLISTIPSWAFTQPAQPVTTESVRLCGTVDVAAGAKVWFEWGAVGGVVQKTDEFISDAGGLQTRVTTLLTNLGGRANYQYRIVASDATGVVYGAPVLFTTGQKISAWGFGVTNIPAGLSNIVAVAGNRTNSLALKSDGTVVAWGHGTFGLTNVPEGLSNVVNVAQGGLHALALKSDGTVVGWGYNLYGQATAPLGLSNVIAVSAGMYHSVALKSDGTVVAWGRNSSGKTNVPAGLSNALAVATYADHSLALKADGKVVAWGANTFGQTNVPVGLSNVLAVAAGAYHSLALKSDGKVVAWGENSFGQTAVPAELSNVVVVIAGGFHSMALKSNGTVVAWGANYTGQANVPAGLSNSVAIGAGAVHSLSVAQNVAPSANSLSITGAVGLGFVVSLKGSDANNDALKFRISSLPASGSLFQYSGSGQGAAILIPDTFVDDPFSRLLFVPDSDAGGWPYTSFAYVADDGESGSARATVTVNIIPSPVIDPASLVVNSNSSISFSFSGDTNVTYRAWGSTNLTVWSLLGSASQSPPGRFNFTDNGATNRPVRFYRVTSP